VDKQYPQILITELTPYQVQLDRNLDKYLDNKLVFWTSFCYIGQLSEYCLSFLG